MTVTVVVDAKVSDYYDLMVIFAMCIDIRHDIMVSTIMYTQTPL